MSKTVMIVEDNDLNLKLLNDLLQVNGYRTLPVTEGLKVLDMAREQSPDLIVMDIQLPDISGLDVTRKLKEDERFRDIPIVAVTAFALKGDEEKCREAGCEDYVAKPISVPNFLATVAKFIG